MTENKTKVRITALAAVVIFLFASLGTRLWYLQVLAQEEFADRAESNRVRVVPQVAPRGWILDRNGEPLVKNRTTTIVRVDRSVLKGERQEAVIAELSEILEIPVDELNARLEDRRYFAYQPVPIAFDVKEPAALYLGEHSARFPGVTVDVGPVREYPAKNLAAHILGYTGQISAEDFENPRFEDYDQAALLGKAGVERVYEEQLQGTSGYVNYQVNAQGKVLGKLGEKEPEHGDNLVLSIDLETQRISEESLKLGIELARTQVDEDTGQPLRANGGAAVVMDPTTGQVLAMASYPTFDPSRFIGGITQRDLAKLVAEKRNFPLLNRAIQSAYPPGSTFKPFVAAAAVKQKLTNLNDYTPCPAAYKYRTLSGEEDPSGTEFKNWKTTSGGPISLGQALIESCDTVFYEFGTRFYHARQRADGEEFFQERLREWGFDAPTGIDLPSEREGRIPDIEFIRDEMQRNPLFRADRPCDEPCWVPGDDINMSIGQGNVETSPMQLAVAYSALANGGTIFEPRLGMMFQRPDGTPVEEIEPVHVGRLPYSRNVLTYIRDSLRGVVTTGTAAGAFVGFPLDAYPVAGKTGTAEIKPKQPFSWFAAMAPAGNPKYVVVAVVEEGGHGSTTAAPVVRRILEGLFDITPGELQSGGVTD